MSLPYRIRPAARRDIDDAYDWYESMEPGRGDGFLVELHERIEDIRERPYQSCLVRQSVRASMLPKSNFVIYYRVVGDCIMVLAVQLPGLIRAVGGAKLGGSLPLVPVDADVLRRPAIESRSPIAGI